MASMVVTGGEFEINACDLHFLGRVFHAEVGETDLAVNNRNLQFMRESSPTALRLTLALRLVLTKFAVQLFLKFVVELNPEHLSTFAFNLISSLLIQAVQGGIMVCFLGFRKARVDGLIVGYEAVATNQAFAFLCQSEDQPGLLLEYARVPPCH